MDERINILAKNIVQNSLKVRAGEKVLIEYNGEKAINFVKAVM